MIPGLPMVPGGGGSYSIRYSSSTNNVNLFTALGSPTGPVDVTVIIDSGVTIGSADADDPAFLIQGFASGCRFFITNNGHIGGAGGAGGDGFRGRSDSATPSTFVGGGGGGGAGSVVGAGGAAASALYGATDGGDGTATTGGAAGVNDFGGAIPVGGYTGGSFGQEGGTGVMVSNPLQWQVYFTNNGTIYSGGSGGDGGRQFGSLPNNVAAPTAGQSLPTTYTLTVTSSYLSADINAVKALSSSGTGSDRIKFYKLGTWSYPSIRGRVMVHEDL